jgi:hypothetical protein
MTNTKSQSPGAIVVDQTPIEAGSAKTSEGGWLPA